MTDTIVKFTEMPMGRIRHIHFVGIGGSGMSGIAEVLHHIGYQISGSDLQPSKVTDHLGALGIQIHMGHHADQVTGADVVVTSTAVQKDNPEVVQAQQLRIPVIPRAQMLAELMRFRYGIAVAGTHGKTTTTSLVASILAAGGLDPTFVIGGRLNSAKTHAKLGASPYLVAEADESDASFLHLQPMISIITNLEEDHMSTYGGDFRRLQQTFVDFVHQLPFYGLVIVCLDDPNLARLLPRLSRRVATYAIENPDADYIAYDIQQQGMQTVFKVRQKDQSEVLPLCLNMPGRHNVLNALAALIVARELRIGDAGIQQALREFAGVGRRFQVLGQIRDNVLVIDDYAHHPSEIRATLQAVRQGWPKRRMVVVFQPHRYSRTQDLYDDFVAVLGSIEHLILLNVYSAGEPPIVGADSRCLCRSLRNQSKREPILVQQAQDLVEVLQRQLGANDILLTMGAGSIGNIAADLVKQLAADG